MSGHLQSNRLAELVEDCKVILIIGHFNPDGDSIGSITGMYHYLRARGKITGMISPNIFPDFLKFLDPESEPVLIYESDSISCKRLIEDADLILCLDFNKLERTEWMSDDINRSHAKKVLIDHHPNPDSSCFDLVISDVNISSTCELIYRSLMQMPDINGDVRNLSIDCAISLYTGIMTDTNNFNNSVFPSTFQIAGDLLKRGVDKNHLQEEVFCSYSEERMRLMGLLLEKRMIVIKEFGVAYILLSDEDKNAHNFATGDSEGFVNLPLSIKGIKMTALFSDSKGFVRVSLRSKGDTDVNLFSQRYCNGGGHKNASGGRLFMPLSEVPDYFENAIKKYFSEK